MFTTVGDREGEKALLEFKKTQWKKELGNYNTDYLYLISLICSGCQETLHSLCFYRFTCINAIATNLEVMYFRLSLRKIDIYEFQKSV